MVYSNNNKIKKQELNKRIFRFSLEIIKLTDSLRSKGYGNIIIGKQLLRNPTSVDANIIEAQSGSSKKDFINLMNHFPISYKL